ncbi:MAG: TonB-dependent receptor [Kiritimatiellia bacterium]
MRKIAALSLLPLVAACLMAADAAAQTVSEGAGLSGAPRSFQSFNPDISAIVDMYYHQDDSKEGISHVLEGLSGFGHVHSGGEAHHHGPDEGFNLRHLELQFSADVDPYFKGWAIAAVDTESAEMEEAVIETTCLPWGLKLKGGKFFSDFGYINAQHSHQWDFSDQPLIYKLCLGDHGLNDKGLQLSWLAPTPFYLLTGVEALQGDNEVLFDYHGEEPLPTHDGPRVGVGWLKIGPNLPGNHGLQFGAFGATGKHQEAHDSNADGADDHWLDGDSSFWGGDFVYKYNAPQAHGERDFVFQGEYFSRRKDMELVGHEFAPQLVGNNRQDDQDGYYVQAVYGFLPRWRAGLRWEQVGLTNESDLPDGSSESFDSSDRLTAMVDFTPSEFSRLRLQVNQGAYETAEGAEDVTEVYLQWMISLGAHGAHKF